MDERICSVVPCDRSVLAKGMCAGHYQQAAAGKPFTALRSVVYGSAEKRFFAKVKMRGDCWEWVASKNRYGYGKFGVCDGRVIGAHRWAYEFLRAKIPDGLHLDHLCRNRACVNPWHLEPVTALVNNERIPPENRVTPDPWSVCGRGHPMTPENVYVNPTRGNRYCRICQGAARRAWNKRRKAS